MKKKCMLFVVASIFITSMSLQTITAQSWSITGNGNATSVSKLGTTNFIPLKLYTNDTERVRISENGRVGIGINSPVNILTVKSTPGGIPAGSWLNGLTAPVFVGFADNASCEFVLATASNTPVRRSVIQGRKSRGTLAAPTAVVTDDYLTSFLASGYDGSTFQNPATIDFFVDSTPSAGNVPARISFVTGSNQANRTERLKVGSTGNFDFNGGQVTLTHSNGNLGIGVGNLNFSTSLQTIQFANPGAASNAMLTMFTSGTQNPDRMVIAHSSALPGFGLQYQDSADKFNFLSGGTPVLTADLGGQRVGIGTSSPTLAKMVVEGLTGNTVALFRGSPTSKGISIVADFPGVYFNSYWNAGQKAMAPGYAGILNFDPFAGNIYLGVSSLPAANAGDLVQAPPATLLIDKNGNVGIGASPPAAKLDIRNPLGIPGISVNNSFVANEDGIGVFSYAVTNPGYGYGVRTEGGYCGTFSTATGGANTDVSIAVYGEATGSAGSRYGIFGRASGGTFNAPGYFDGPVFASAFNLVSDRKFKTDIALIKNPLLQIMKLKPSTYVFKQDDIARMGLPEGNQLGLIADEVKQVFPELVKNAVEPAQYGKDRSEVIHPEVQYEAVNYIGLIPVLVASTQEQQKQIELQQAQLQDQQKQIELQRAQIEELKDMIKQVSQDNGIKTDLNSVSLEQNNPNPLDKFTNIRYSIPAGSKNAWLVVADMNGKKIKQIQLGSATRGNISFDATALASGTYTYSIIIDGKLTQSKKMIVTKSSDY